MPGKPRLRRAVALALAGMLTLGLVGTGTEPASAAVSNREMKLRAMINKSRDVHNVRRLKLNRNLSTLARRHSRQMARSGSIYHSNTHQLYGYMDSGNCSARIGENVGRSLRKNGVRGIHKMYMGSPGHRDNILRSYWRKVGVGIYRSGRWFYSTEIFCV